MLGQPDALVLKLRFLEVIWRSAGVLKRRLPRCQILGFYKSLADQGLADPQLSSRGMSLAMVIMQDAPPKLKRFLKPLGRKATVRALLIRCIVAVLLHRGRMGAD